MIRHKYVRNVLCALLITMCLSLDSAQSKQNDKSETPSQSDLGRDDPFASFSESTNPVSSQAVTLNNTVNKPELYARTVSLKFLEAKNLQKALEGMLSAYGSIATDESTNSLIVCDDKNNLDKIIAEIKKADKTPEQITIEVFILDVQLDDDTEIGVNWDRLFEPKRKQQYTQTLAATLAGTSAGTAAAGADFTFVHTDISGAIHALQEIRNVEILASPRISVVSGQSAFIQTTEEIPYTETTGTAEGGANALSSTEFKDAGIMLTVKATVIEDNKILMKIRPEQSSKTGETGIGDNDVPIVDKRIVETTLLMADNDVVVMGGLRKKETRISRDQIPILGDLPLIGFLFANNKEEVKHSELLVLISPHIDKGEPVDEEAMEKYNELKNKPLLSLPKKEDKKKELISSLKHKGK